MITAKCDICKMPIDISDCGDPPDSDEAHWCEICKKIKKEKEGS
jgi:hypothetical protein